MSKIVKSKQSYSNHHLSYHYYYFGRTSIHNMALEFACAQRIIMNVLKLNSILELRLNALIFLIYNLWLKMLRFLNLLGIQSQLP